MTRKGRYLFYHFHQLAGDICHMGGYLFGIMGNLYISLHHTGNPISMEGSSTIQKKSIGLFAAFHVKSDITVYSAAGDNSVFVNDM